MENKILRNIIVYTIITLIGLVNCKYKNQKNKQAILNIPTSLYGSRGLAAGDMDGDGLTDLLSTNGAGDVYFHKNLGNGQYAKR